MKAVLTLASLIFFSVSFQTFGQVTPPKTAALTGQIPFAIPTAINAQKNYAASIDAARKAYAAGLDLAVKSALTAGSLDDANAIKQARGKLVDGSLPTADPPFKTAQANQARIQYENAVATAQKQYGRDLQIALKNAMTAGNLDEANKINGEISALTTSGIAANSGVRSPGAPSMAIGQSGQVARGLVMVRYRKHPSQQDGDKYKGYVQYTDLGKPIGAPHTVRSLAKWTKDIDENAIVSGFIRIEKPGIYEFRTDSDFDRNELIIDGKIVCNFRDGAKKTQTADLRAGLLPIISVGYANATTETRVEWKPSGQADFSEIPATLFSH